MLFHKRTLLFFMLIFVVTASANAQYADEIYLVFDRAAKQELVLDHFQSFSPEVTADKIQVMAYTEKSTPYLLVFNNNTLTFKRVGSFLNKLVHVRSFEQLGGKRFLLTFVLNQGVHGQRLLLIEPQSGAVLLDEASDWGIKLNADAQTLWFMVTQDEKNKRIEWPESATTLP